MATKFAAEDPVHAARHCLEQLPYRMIVFERMNRATPLYRVAGSSETAMGAKKALREAFRIHDGKCFYCKDGIKKGQLTIDHVETADGGKWLQNLVIACRPCNQKKADKRIEAFHPDAGREWLGALLLQVQDRLNRL